MKRSVMLWGLLLTVMVMSVFTGCGGPDNTSDGVDSGFVTGVDNYYINAAPEYSSSGRTCTLNLKISYSSISVSAIDTISITAPDGGRWLIPGSSLSSSTTSPMDLPLVDTPDHFTFPLGGTWTTEIRLKDGRFSAATARFHEPGTLNVATHPYIYTAADWSPSSATHASYVAMLGRFPTSGVSLTYSADNGGSITSTGFAAAESAYLSTEPMAYNLYCELYDSTFKLLGTTLMRYTKTDHTDQGLVGTDGELIITAAKTTNSSLDLSTVKYMRIITVDGAQFQASSPGTYQQVAVSSVLNL